MQDVYYESTAFGDVLVDENGDPLAIVFESGGGEPGGGSGVWKDPVQAVEDLPADGNAVDDIRLVRSEFLLYVWTGTTWEIIGLPWDSDGPGGEPVVTQWKDSVATVGNLPTIDNVLGDARLVRDERRVYTWNGSDWQALQDSVGSGGAGSLSLGDELSWLESDGDTGGSFLIRAQSDTSFFDMQADPGLVTEGFGGLVYYPPDESGPGGYEPNRGNSSWDLQRVRRESRSVVFKKDWEVYVEGTVEDDYVFNGLHSLAATVGRPGFDGYSTLYGEIDRVNNLLRFGRVSGSDQTMSYVGLESVALPSPPAGSDFWIDMWRDGDTITLMVGVSPPVGDYYEAEVTHEVTLPADTWMQPNEGLYPGFGSQWGDLNYGHVFTYVDFYAGDAWRELVLRLKSASAVSPEVDLVLADSRTGWLVGADLTVNGETEVDTITVDGPQVSHEYDPATDSVAIHIAPPTTEDMGLPEIDWPSLMAATAKRPFIPLDTNEAGGITQPVLETDPDVAGPRYFCSYMHNADGFVVFRGFFIAAAAGSGLIGILDEAYWPPHTVRMGGVREDGTVFAVRVEPNGEIYSYGHQTGRNHLDGSSFYQGKGPVVIVGTFIPDENNPYRLVSASSSDPNHRFDLVGAGIFEFPRESDSGQLMMTLPDPGGFNWYWASALTNPVTYEVISGPQTGQTGAAIISPAEGTPVGSTTPLIITIPAGIEGEVRVTFNGIEILLDNYGGPDQ